MRSRFDLSGKTAAVIGAGSGIGAAVARGCAEHGATVACLDLDGAAAAATAATIVEAGGQATSAPVDVREAASVTDALGRAAARAGLDVVISTPGINIRKTLLDYSDDEFDRVVAVNLKGTLHVLQTAGRLMVARRSGSIVVFSSIRSRVVEPGQGVYAATKAGLELLVRTLATELGPLGVRVNAIAPAAVDTPLAAPIRNDPRWRDAYTAKSVFGRWAAPEELVGAAIYLASDAAASYVTGTVLFVDAGWTVSDGRFRPPGI